MSHPFSFLCHEMKIFLCHLFLLPGTWGKTHSELTSVSVWLRISLSPIGGFCQEFCHDDGKSIRPQTPIYRRSILLWRTAIKDTNKEDEVYTFFHSSPFYDPYLKLDDWRVVNCSGLWVQIIHLKCSITKSWISWVVIITKLLYKHCILFIVNI